MKKKRFESDGFDKEEDLQEDKELSSDTTDISVEFFWIKKDLIYLKELLMDWVIDEKTFEDLASKKDVVSVEGVDLKKLIEKIEELEKNPAVEKLLPKNYLITAKEYLLSIKDPSKKTILLQKISDALSFMYNQRVWRDKLIIKRFAIFTTLLHKSISNVLMDDIHDTYIDVQDSLI